MSEESGKEPAKWTKYADAYDPIKVGSIDGTDAYPHDNGIVRALNAHYRPNERVAGSAKHTIFIGRLHPRTDEDTLKHRFRRYGKIVNCRVVRDLVTGASKQYAFIEYGSSSDAREAVNAMDKYRLDDSEIIVDHEHERRLAGWKPRRLGGGFGGRKESGQLRFGCRARPFQKPFDSSKPLSSSDLKEVFRYAKSRSANKHHSKPDHDR